MVGLRADLESVTKMEKRLEMLAFQALRWELQNLEIGSCKTATRSFFYLDQVAGLGFKFELVSFQAAVSLIFCFVFSLWLHFFYISTDYNIRTGDPWTHLVQFPSIIYEKSGSREVVTSSRSYSKLVELLKLEAHLLNSRPKLLSLMDIAASICWFSKR